MKKTLGILSTSIVGASLMMGFAAADTVSCGTISNTGAGSTNTVTCTDKNSIQVDCDNNIVTELNNNQNSNSGNVNSSSNTTSGFTTSGSATSSNTASVDVGASCAPIVAASTTPAATTPASTTPAMTTPAAPAAAKAAPAVAALPETGSDSAVKTAGLSVAVLGSTMAAAQVGIRLYRKLALR